MRLLDEFQYKKSNVTHIINLLEKSIADNNYEAMAKLGEILFLGLPI